MIITSVNAGMVITQEEATYLKELTKLQSQSTLWLEHKIGRITASKFHAVKHTSLESPPTSLVKQIMKKSTHLRMFPPFNGGSIRGCCTGGIP